MMERSFVCVFKMHSHVHEPLNTLEYARSPQEQTGRGADAAPSVRKTFFYRQKHLCRSQQRCTTFTMDGGTLVNSSES